VKLRGDINKTIWNTKWIQIRKLKELVQFKVQKDMLIMTFLMTVSNFSVKLKNVSFDVSQTVCNLSGHLNNVCCCSGW
jgi:hypothetical protein